MQDTSDISGADRAAAAASSSPPAAPATGGGAGTLWLFTAATFFSALLLFAVQPMFAKMVLPVLGGSPSVWAVAMLFFQAALLAGYCYAHLLIRFVPAARSGFIHLAVCATAVVSLPIGLPAFFGEPPAGEPYLWQLGLFAVAVGLPFFAVSANAPLMQAWFSATGHPHGRDPYFLYGASNLGSLIALLSYPLLLEPTFGLKALSVLWAAGYGILILFIAACFLTVRRSGHAPAFVVPPRSTITLDIDGRAPTWTRRLGWVGLALVPSALLTAFTNHITMDVASAPLLWVLPLSLYLFTFVLVFRDKPIVAIPVAVIVGLGIAAGTKFIGDRFFGTDLDMQTLLLAGVAAAVVSLVLQWALPATSLEWMRGVHVAAVIIALLAMAQTRFETWFISSATGVAVFFVATMVAHRTLYEQRPAARYLTEFYLWMSLGGVLGGLFAALIAPKIFSEIFEYPILVALTMACRPGVLNLRGTPTRRNELFVLLLLAILGVAGVKLGPQLLAQLPAADAYGMPAAAWWLTGPVTLYQTFRLSTIEWGATPIIVAAFALVLIAAWQFPRRQFILALAMCFAVVVLPSGVRRSDAQRSYFGVYRVYQSGDYNILMHGTTLHGAQRVRDDKGDYVLDLTPGTYYHPTSPMARSVELVRENVSKKGGTNHFGVIGLGSGSLACHAAEGETWRFFEIDPVMIGIASNTDNFSYLANCQPSPPDIALGDARLTMAKEANDSFDLIIVDAFSSDAVPIHLMTAEAVKLYLNKVGPNGIAVLHISNRYLDLDSVLGATINLVPGAHGLIVSDDTSDGGYGSTSSTIAVFAKNDAALEPFRALSEVRKLDSNGLKAWTDDYSDIIGPFLSKMRSTE